MRKKVQRFNGLSKDHETVIGVFALPADTLFTVTEKLHKLGKLTELIDCDRLHKLSERSQFFCILLSCRRCQLFELPETVFNH